MPRIRPRRGSRRGVELSKPFLRVYTPEASGRLRERLSSRERFAHPAAVREASLVGIQTRAEIEAKPRGPDSISARVRVGSPLPPILSTRSQGRRGIARRPHVQYLHPGVAGIPRARSFICTADFLAQSFISGEADAMRLRSTEGDRPCQPN